MTQRVDYGYQELEVYASDPVELIRMLYRIALEEVERAMECLGRGDRRGRSDAISRTAEALLELVGCLDVEHGGEIAQRLLLLYDYMQRCLLEANAKERREPLETVAKLLRTLLEAWEQIDYDTAVKQLEKELGKEAVEQLEARRTAETVGKELTTGRSEQTADGNDEASGSSEEGRWLEGAQGDRGWVG